MSEPTLCCRAEGGYGDRCDRTDGVRRQLGTGCRTVWEWIKPLLAAPDADPCRFEGVKT